MRLNLILASLVFLLPIVSGGRVAADELRSYPCYLLTARPVLDGRADDSVWRTVPEATGFAVLGGDSWSSRQTAFKMGHDGTALYLLVKCEEPDMDKIVGKFKDMGALWEEDSVEVFLQPENSGIYYQFIISSLGSRWNGCFKEGKNTENKLFDWQAVALRDKNRWTVEITIPFSSLGAGIKDGTAWRGNICRDICTAGDEEKSAGWAPQTAGFHEKEAFGRIVFSNKILTETMAAEVERQTVNKPVHTAVDRETAKLIVRLSSWQKLFTEMSKTHQDQELKEMLARLATAVENPVSPGSPASEKLDSLQKLKTLFRDADQWRGKLLLERFASGG